MTYNVFGRTLNLAQSITIMRVAVVVVTGDDYEAGSCSTCSSCSHWSSHSSSCSSSRFIAVNIILD